MTSLEFLNFFYLKLVGSQVCLKLLKGLIVDSEEHLRFLSVI